MPEKLLYVAQKGKAVPWEIPLRDLEPTEVRVKVHSVGINPIDWKTIDNNFADGAGQGNDFSGTVIETGSEVKYTKVGDTVAGGVGGGNVDSTEQGAFTDLLSVEEHLLFKFPVELKSAQEDHLKEGIPTTFEQAASLGIAADTSAIAFEGFETPKTGSWALIYGVTSSLGYVAAQYARNVGYNVIGISGPSPVLSGLGIKWIDRHDPDWVQKAKDLSNDSVSFAFDTICLNNSFNDVAQTLSAELPSVLALSARAVPDKSKINEKTKVTHPMYFHLMQETKKMGTSALPDQTGTIKRAPNLVGQLNEQFSKNEIRTLPIYVLHGLDKVNQGLDLNRSGVRGTKVVINLD